MSQEYKNINDDKLDKLFKDAAGNFVPPDAPKDAWDHFYETKLNVPKEKKSGSRLKGFLPIFFNSRISWQLATFCSLFFIAVIWIGLSKWGNNKTQHIVLSSQNHGTAIANEKPEEALLNKSNNPVSGSSNNIQEAAIQNNAVQKAKNTAASSLSYSNPVAANDSFQKSQQQAFIKNNLPGSNSLAANTNKEKNSAIPMNKKDSVFNKNIAINHQEAEKKIPKLPTPDFDYNENNNNNQKEKHWQVALVGGTNLGMVGGSLSNSAGVNTGIMVQHRIKKSRFSVETGIVRESMAYDVSNNDYTPNGNPASYNISNVRGTCTMVDVPVNVRYDVVHSKKNNAFVSTGVSATLMADQNISYDYAHSDGTTSTVNKNVDGQGKTVYATTNLAVGYERKFNNTAVQVAPYVKIPLGSVGYGNLNLGSVGAQISIKQSF